MLKVNGIYSGYGVVEVLKDCSIEINQGEILSIIGANGVGKTTLVNTISGMVRCNKGKIHWQGKDITNLPPHQRVKDGIVQVPEGRQIFGELTVAENLKLGAFNWISNRNKALYREELDKVYELFPRLYERKNQKAGTMSGGEQQMLALGRALMSLPKLIMLDEPSLGLAPLIVDMLFVAIKNLNSQLKLPMILIEQNAEIALEVCDRGYVMEAGKIVLSGRGDELARNPKVKEIYLGAAT